MPKINREEYDVLKALDSRAKSIVRQARGWLWVAEQPIMKDKWSWFVADGFEEKLEDDNLFQFIQWEDEEPHNIAELIEEYESGLIKPTPWTPNTLDFESEDIEMKKDIKWLKAEVNRIIRDKGPDVINYYEYMSLKSSLNELIDQLDEPEVLSQEWIDEYATEVTYDEVLDQTEIVYVDELENLLVPKQEIAEEQVMDWLNKNDFYDHITAETVLERAVDKGELSYYGTKYSVIETPTIPKYVAEWIEEVKDKEWTLYGAMSECPREVDYWLIDGDCSNQDTFARAWLDGYTVEKEQKYYAKIKGWEFFVDFVGAQYWGVVSNYGRLGFVNVDGAKDRTKDEWRRLGINDSNAEFVEVAE